MNDSMHKQYRVRLSVLQDAAVINQVADACHNCAWWPLRSKWQRIYGRFDPEQEPFVTLVYETMRAPQVILRVEAHDARPLEMNDVDLLLNIEAIGWLRVTPFPSDLVLHTLPAVLQAPGRATIVRYRPARRCTIRFDENGSARFAKVFADKRGEKIHSAGKSLWRAANDGELDFAVAEPDCWDERALTLWQRQIVGTPIVPKLFGDEGARIAYRVGRAAASLTCSTLQSDEVFDSAAQLARTIRYGQDLQARIPRLASMVEELIGILSDWREDIGERPLRPIHGAPHAHQWLACGERLGLVDFDRMSLGDPELDAATFLAELDFEKQLRLPMPRLAEAFLAGYEAVAGKLDPQMLNFYRVQKRLAKARRSARSVRTDGDLRAERHLAQAVKCMLEASI